jgi:hypothetical protein
MLANNILFPKFITKANVFKTDRRICLTPKSYNIIEHSAIHCQLMIPHFFSISQVEG